MQVQGNNHASNGLGGILNEANKLLKESVSTGELKAAAKVSKSEDDATQTAESTERQTFGLVSLEIMSDEQYQAFMRVTATMSPSEKIAVAQTLTRAGNLNVSVEQMRQKEAQDQAIADQNLRSANGFLGVSSDGWQAISREFQDNLNHLDGLYSKSYNKAPSSNYNDIFRKNAEAKTQRILREFSHAIYSGGVQIDTMG